MPDTVTANYGFTKPDPGGSNNTWGPKLNADLDSIDATIKALSNLVAAKLNASGYTAADVLAKLLTVDGSGSGIDADKLDGLDASGFASAGHTHTGFVPKMPSFAANRLFYAAVGDPDPMTQAGDMAFAENGGLHGGGVFLKLGAGPGNFVRIA